MCTVTVLPARQPALPSDSAPLVRILCNRDEQRSRPASSGLQVRVLEGVRCVMPIDPPSGGTWIGVSEHGLVACLLNATAARARIAPGRASRGTIVPSMLGAYTLRAALARLHRLAAPHFPPFRLLLLDRDSYLIAASDGARLSTDEPKPLDGPILLTSSGLGDHIVQPPRQALFHSMVLGAADPLRAQARFHEHRWPDRSELSVAMSRPEARTVSRTRIDLCPGHVEMRHRPLDDALIEGAETAADLSLAGALLAA